MKYNNRPVLNESRHFDLIMTRINFNAIHNSIDWDKIICSIRIPTDNPKLVSIWFKKKSDYDLVSKAEFEMIWNRGK